MAKLIQVNEFHCIDPNMVFHVQIIGAHVVMFFGDAKDNRRIDIDCGSADAAKTRCAEIVSTINIECAHYLPTTVFTSNPGHELPSKSKAGK